MIITQEDLLAEVDWLEEQLDRLPRIEGPNYIASREARRLATDYIVIETRNTRSQASVAFKNGGAVFRWHDFRATSTNGLDGAMRNWIRQVRTKAARSDP